jgi:tRNA threonylcarbamoyladenosine biosynthesis protein TsaE
MFTVSSQSSIQSAVLRRLLPDLNATEALGEALSTLVKPGMLVTLDGALGSGKTALVRAMLKAWGFHGRVKSPSYTLIEQYEFDGFEVCHFDFYRFNQILEADQAGFREHFDGQHICIVEWPDRAQNWLPLADLQVKWWPVDTGRLVSLETQKELKLPEQLPGIVPSE